MTASRSSISAPEVNGAPPANPFSWRFTTPLFIGSALNPINSSLIATALVPIAHGLGVSIGQTAALVTALYLASAIAQPTAGKAAEVFGPRRVFLIGIVLVAAGGLLGGFAQDLLTLLISRVLIGLGTSCAYPTAMLLIRRRARDVGLDKPPGGVLGGLQIAGIATASLGLPIGGALVGALGWRAVFFVNVPVALVALVATLAWVSPDGPLDRTRRALPLLVHSAARVSRVQIAVPKILDRALPCRRPFPRQSAGGLRQRRGRNLFDQGQKSGKIRQQQEKIQFIAQTSAGFTRWRIRQSLLNVRIQASLKCCHARVVT